MTRKFTGRHMLAIMLAFFAVVIGVNFTMATLASRTFGGTVVDNSYVAGQKFNTWLAAGRAQERLGWRTALELDRDRRVTVALRDGAGPLAGAEIDAVARHPLGRAPDIALRFSASPAGTYVSHQSLPAGRWLVHLHARSGAAELRVIETLS